MILTNRLFTRREPVKEAKSVYIFVKAKNVNTNISDTFRVLTAVLTL